MPDRYFKELSTNELYVKTELDILQEGVPDASLFEELSQPQDGQRYDNDTGAWVAEEFDKDGNPYT